MQRIERRAEATVRLEGEHPLFGLAAEGGGHNQAGREFDFHAVVGKVELRDASLDMAPRAAVEYRALEDDVAALLEAKGEVGMRRLIVGQVEPEGRACGINGEGMRRIALQPLKFQRELHAVASPALLAKAIIARWNKHRRHVVAEGCEYLWQDGLAGIALGLFLCVRELRSSRGGKTERRVRCRRGERGNTVCD